MMALDNDRIKALLAKKAAEPTKQSRAKKTKGDPNDRSFTAWFALEHHLLDDAQEPMYCNNPDCIDPRDKTHGQVVVELPASEPVVRLCRFCFVEGWLLVNESQQQLQQLSDDNTLGATGTDG
jgi:hypothetical protein